MASDVQGAGQSTRFAYIQSRCLGLTLIVVGLLSVSFNIVDLKVGDTAEYDAYFFDYPSASYGCLGYGIWCGALCVVAGVFGIAASIWRIPGIIRTLMVLSIIAAVLCAVELALGVAGAVHSAGHKYSCFCRNTCATENADEYGDGDYEYHYNDVKFPARCRKMRTIVAMQSLMAIMGFIGGIATIWVSALCCLGACCCVPDAVHPASTSAMQQQTAIINPGQVNAGYNGPPGSVGVVQMPYGQPELARAPNAVTSFQHLHSLYLGVAMILAGALSIIFNIVDLSVSSSVTFYSSSYYYEGYYYSSLSFAGHGLWSGIMCIIAGGFGVGASRSKTVGMIRSFLVLSIIAASCCLGQLGVGIGGTCSAGVDYYDCDTNSSQERCAEIRTLIAMEALLAILSLVGGVAAIWGSALCCKAACCCSGCCCCNYAAPNTSTNGVVYYSVPMTVSTQQQQQQQPDAPQFLLMYKDVPQGLQYIHPGQQFVAGTPPPYVVGSPPYSQPYSPPMPMQSVVP